jgi:hypothetical protein
MRDRIILRRQANEVPTALRRESQTVQDDFPLLAVAIGGALPNPFSEGDSPAVSPGTSRGVELGGYYTKGI